MAAPVEPTAAVNAAAAPGAAAQVATASAYLGRKHPVLQGMLDQAWKMRDEANPATVYLLLHLVREVFNGFVNAAIKSSASRENQKKILEGVALDWAELEALVLTAIADQPKDPRAKQREEAAARIGPALAQLRMEETGRERIAVMLRIVTGGNLAPSDPVVVHWHKVQRGAAAKVHFNPDDTEAPPLEMAHQLLDRLTHLFAELASKPSDRLDAVDDILQELTHAA